jgi:DNA adenine methylase
VKPFTRWAGGKRWLAERVAAEIEEMGPRVYVEPFVGGGAIALAIKDSIPKILNDTNTTLMDAWRCLQRSPTTLIAELERVVRQYPNSQAGYLDARAELNRSILDPCPYWFRRAALFLYINARCYNGLWRTNSRGFFNVPWGKFKEPASIDIDEAARLYGWLQTVQLFTMKAHDLLANSDVIIFNRGVAVYADCPYHDTFTGYTKDGFNENDQRDLAADLEQLAYRGSRIWATNSDTPLIREIYAWAKIEEIDERHSVGPTKDQRGKKKCLLIRS